MKAFPTKQCRKPEKNTNRNIFMNYPTPLTPIPAVAI